MELGLLTQIRRPDALYRCDSMPPGRAYVHLWLPGEGGSVYIRADGSREPFDFLMESRKYYGDSTWEEIGEIKRLAPDGRIDLDHLAVVLG